MIDSTQTADHLTDGELMSLVFALEAGEEREVTDDEVAALANWVHGARTAYILTRLVFDGSLKARRQSDGDYQFQKWEEETYMK